MTVAPHSFDADEFHDFAEPHASAEPASPAAVLKDIRFSYDRGTSWALDGVSLTVHAGERLCLVGPNGSGKSTLARLIAGLTAPDGGEVTLLGQRVYAAGPNADAYRAARHGIGMVFQNPEDQLVTTVLEDDVAFGPENLGLERELIGERIVDSLQAVGLANLRQSDPTRMSGGQQQRASIAGMLAMNPAMLVLDEPTAMLDESARAEVMRILDDLQARGTTIVHVTHHPDETVHADRIVHMEAGRIIGITAAVDNRSPLAEAVSQSETEGSIGTEAAPSRPTNDSPRQREREDGSELPLLSDGIGDMTNPIIRVSHLTYRYPSAKRAVIDDLSFTIARGETVALMGVNGSGKSTLVRMLCALTAPTAGSIEVAGVPVASTGKRGRNVRPKSANRKQLAQLRRHVGYVMQHPEHQLFADTVAEDVAYGPRNQGLGETEVADRVRESLELLHIGHLADRSPFDLSGGQQRLAAIAGVLACNPDVLIMDEPTASLDAQAKKRIHELLRTLKSRGVTVLIITHDREEAEQIADRVVRMPIAAPASGGPVTATVTEPAVSSNGPAHSVIHRLDPRVKMVGFLAAMFTMFAVNTPTQLALGIAITLAVIAAARLNPLRCRIHSSDSDPAGADGRGQSVCGTHRHAGGGAWPAKHHRSGRDHSRAVRLPFRIGNHSGRGVPHYHHAYRHDRRLRHLDQSAQPARYPCPRNRAGHESGIAIHSNADRRNPRHRRRPIRAWRFHRNRFTGPAHQGDERDYRADFRRHVASRGQPEPRT